MSELRAEIFRLIDEGVTQAEIARRLGVAAPTVNYHVSVLRRPSTREAIAALLSQGVSRAETARRLGIAKSTVSYHARNLGEPVDERAARRYDWAHVQAYYDEGHTVDECVEAFGFCKQAWHAAKLRGDIRTRPKGIPVEALFVKGPFRDRGHLRRRLTAAKLKPEGCERCRLEEWMGAPIPLELHHVNGDRHDNRLENLQLLCSNCHGQTGNYAGRKRPKAA